MPVINRFTGEYSFLSNFYLCVIDYEGIQYGSTEHAYQASKTLDFNKRSSIAKIAKPGIAKKTAYTFKLRPNWDNMKVQVMRDVLRIKFSAEPLRSWLIATENDELIEGNDHGDEFWGVCDGVGENYLGNLLMELRSELAGVK